MIRLFFILLISIFLKGPLSSQNDEAFIQAMKLFHHRIQHPGDEDLGFKAVDFSLLTNEERLDAFYAAVIKEKKEYIISQIGLVSADLIFEQFIYSHFTEKEIYDLKDRFSEQQYHSVFGKQVRDIIHYYDSKIAVKGKIFPQLSLTDTDEIFYSFPYLGRDRYILLHFWSSVCTSCIEKNRRFSELHNAYNRSGIVVISICVDYFPDNWKKVLEEEQFSNPHYYIPRTEFMNLSTSFTLELSTTLLLNADLKIIERDIYKLEDLLETIIFQ